ncbi:rdgC [Symbiodinium natans]|uniref:Serine/threonine-protein phosphatase n=1 Tax=Symbiodinium natans TaxID=878477 RepID=A0A812TB75_9DINO|nr:rdgC [Symbiodinium natans]
MGSAAGAQKRFVYKNKQGKVRDNLTLPTLGDANQASSSTPAPPELAEAQARGSISPQSVRRHTVQDVKQRLLETGLRQDEVDVALLRVAASMIQDAGVAAQAAQALRRASTSEQSQDMGLMDASEILNCIEEQAGVLPKITMPAGSQNRQGKGFATWMERCEALLEEQDEANYLAKKQLAAQVRAYLSNCAETHEKEQLFMRRRVGEMLGDELGRYEDRAPSKFSSIATPTPKSQRGEEEDEDEDEELQIEDSWNSAMVRAKSVKPAVKKERAEGLDMTADELFQKLLARKSRMPISKRYVHRCLDKFVQAWTDRYGRYASLLPDVEVPFGGQTVVVGDTHGQLEDVLTIFLAHGTPSNRNRYIFNGDIADRGPNACEIFLLLFAFFIEDPDSVVIIRGNHEDEEMNKLTSEEGGGFHDEVLKKYTGGVFMKFEAIYKMFPLAAVVQQELFIVHGGLARNAKSNLSLPFVRDIDAGVVSCPHGGCYPLCLEEQVFQDLLWSDPQEKLGWEANPRGAGIKWGPDLTAAFLKRTGLKWIIRSHQLPEDKRGFSTHHLGLVYTLFSASNYCGTSGNKGAVCLLELRPSSTISNEDGCCLAARFEEHYAPALEQGKLKEIAELPDIGARKAALEEAGAARASEDIQKVGQRQERAILHRMAGRVVELRPELWEDFRKCDDKRTGKVTFASWCDILTSVCGENFPWSMGGELWGIIEVDDEEEQAEQTHSPKGKRHVDYRRFLHRFDVGVNKEKWVGWKTILMKDAYEALYCRDSDLKATLALFDPEQTGKVSVQNFLKVLQSEVEVDDSPGQRTSHVLSTSQLQSLAHGLFPAEDEDEDAPAELSVHEFFERFTVIYRQAKAMTGDDPLAEWRDALNHIGHLLLKRDRLSNQPGITRVKTGASVHSRKTVFQVQRLAHQFEKGDESGDGLLTRAELVDYLKGLEGIDGVMHKGHIISDADLEDMALQLDQLSGRETGQVNWFSFLEAFIVERPSGQDFDAAEEFMCEHILSFLYRHRHAVCCGCHEADSSLTGRISSGAFAEVLRGIDISLAKQRRTFSDVQIDGLAESLGEEDGSFSYFELLQALMVRDAEKSGSQLLQ